jgi:hypothetical protein
MELEKKLNGFYSKLDNLKEQSMSRKSPKAKKDIWKELKHQEHLKRLKEAEENEKKNS